MDSDLDECRAFRTERFSEEEDDVLQREVKAHHDQIYGTIGHETTTEERRGAWEEIAEIVSAAGGIIRKEVQCRHRFYYIQRKRKLKIAALKIASRPKAFGDVQIGLHGEDQATGLSSYEDQPQLELQQRGFNMLRSELCGVRQVLASLHSRLDSVTAVLQPMSYISSSLTRIANALDRLPSQ